MFPVRGLYRKLGVLKKSEQLDLMQLQLCRKLAAKHGDLHAHLARRNVDLLDRADRAFHRAGRDLDSITDLVLDLKVNGGFDAHLGNLFLGQGLGLGLRADKAGAAARVAHDVPGVVVHDHFDEDITGIELRLNLFLTGLVAVLVKNFFHAGLGRNLYIADQILQMAVLHHRHKIRSDLVLVAGIGMCYIPVCLLSHGLCLRSTRSGADQQVDGAAKDEIQQDQHDSCDCHDHDNGDRIGLDVALAGPHDLFQLAPRIFEILADPFEKVLDFTEEGNLLRAVVLFGLVALSLGGTQTASLNYALSRNRGNEYSWKAELNVNYTKQDDEYLMPNSVQNAENLSLGLGGKKNFVLGNSLNRRLLIDVHVAYNNNLGGEYVYGGSHADYPTVTELQQGLTNYYTCDYYRIGGSITYSQQVRENRRMNLFAKVVFDRVNTSDYDYDGRTHLSISLGCNF